MTITRLVVTYRFPATPNYIEKKFKEATTINYTTKKGKKGHCSIEQLGQIIEEIDESELQRIKQAFFSKLMWLDHISLPDLSKIIVQMINLNDEFNIDNYDDFVEGYIELLNEINAKFDKYSKIESYLNSIKAVEIEKRKTADYVHTIENNSPQIPPAWPALEKLLDKLDE